MMIVNLETITGMQSWCKILATQFSRIRAEQNLLRKQKRVHKSFLEPTAKPKVTYADHSLEFGKSQ